MLLQYQDHSFYKNIESFWAEQKPRKFLAKILEKKNMRLKEFFEYNCEQEVLDYFESLPKTYYIKFSEYEYFEVYEVEKMPAIFGNDNALYPELNQLAQELVPEIIGDINSKAPFVKSEMPYKSQCTLEYLIKHLEACV